MYVRWLNSVWEVADDSVLPPFLIPCDPPDDDVYLVDGVYLNAFQYEDLVTERKRLLDRCASRKRIRNSELTLNLFDND